MADTDGGASKLLPSPPRPPTIALPPRSSFESLFTGGGPLGFSPGPMTLVSNFFSEQYPDAECRSFSQLLAGAMSSPVAQIPGVRSTSVFPDSSFKEMKSGGDGSEKNSGFKQNRPMSLVVAANSPMFMIPSGLSPSGLLNSPGFFSPGPSPFGMSHQQALAHVTAQAALAHSYQNMQAEYEHNSLTVPAESSEQEQQISTLMSDQEGSRMESPEVSQPDKKPQSALYSNDKPAKDGYNWRKYGQKSVKASEFPRSYYKCTHTDCPARKKVGRSLDGVISDIIYKGKHNHEPPQPNKRSRGVSELAIQSQAEISRSEEALLSQQMPGNNQVSMELTVLEETDDSRIRLNEVDDDEPNPKRRIKEAGPPELPSLHKTVTDTKIVVQTRSEVDLLDDGYKWRKYGQKVVKGNPHPRSYYKCTFTGCNVRKHVERASADPKSVVTTYEGKHNHDIPVPRNRNYNIANNNGLQAKQEKGAILKSVRHKDTNYGNDQRPSLLQLKEEQITA